MVKIVRIKNTMDLFNVSPAGAQMYDHPRMNDLEKGDLVLVRLPDTTITYVVLDVRPSGVEHFDKQLNLVTLDYANPKQKADSVLLDKPPKDDAVFEEEYATAKWRVGRTLGRTIYAMRGAEATDTDAVIGMMDTPALARAAVAAHNQLHYPDEL